MSEETTNQEAQPEEAPKEPEYELAINGVQVRFRRGYPLKLAHLLPAAMDQAFKATKEAMDYNGRLPLLKLCVEAWDHPGDPSKDAGYADLDLFDDVEPMVDAAMDIVLWRLNRKRAAKNSPKAPTST